VAPHRLDVIPWTLKGSPWWCLEEKDVIPWGVVVVPQIWIRIVKSYSFEGVLIYHVWVPVIYARFYD